MDRSPETILDLPMRHAGTLDDGDQFGDVVSGSPHEDVKDARDAGSDAPGEGGDAPMSMDKVTIEALSNELQALKDAFEERGNELEAAKDLGSAFDVGPSSA